jgi:hypothetical protein
VRESTMPINEAPAINWDDDWSDLCQDSNPKPLYSASADYLRRLPDDLTECDQWVLWRYILRNGQWTKVLFQINGQPAATDDPATWNAYETVLNTYLAHRSEYAGIGFVFSADDPFCGVDLDDCLDESGRPKEWARPIIERLYDTYTEISPSGLGLKLFLRAKLYGPGIPKDPTAKYGFEMYDQRRFFTVTGRRFENLPLEIAEHQSYADELYRAHSKRNKFQASSASTESVDGKILKGSRHNTLVSIAGTMRRRGLSAEAINGALQIVNTEQCIPPYDAEHVWKIASSIAEYEPAKFVNGSGPQYKSEESTPKGIEKPVALEEAAFTG